MKKKFRCNEAYRHYNEINFALNKNDVSYPAAAIIHGSRNRAKLFTELEQYIKVHDETITKLTNGGNSIMANDVESIKKMHEAMAEYDNVEIEVEIATVPITDFMKFSYKPSDLLAFEFMIVDDKEE